MKPKQLFHRDFTIMVAGQIMSLFGNSILRFALSLYVLDLTGSAAVFGGILALSMIPTVLFSPVGGVLADRLPRARIMYCLDFATAALIAGFTVLFHASGSLSAITVVMMLLAVIQSFYQPSVQASIPSITADEHLMAANGVVVQVQSLATLVGPILGGFLYGYLGIFPILWASAACFFCSAVMELFLRIPFVRLQRGGSPLHQIRADLGGALSFLRRDNPQLLRLLIVIAGLNLFLSSFFAVGLPFLVRIHLGLSAQLNGFAEAALSLGSILGGLLSGLVGAKLGFHKSYVFLLGTAACLLPAAAAFALALPALVCYGILVGGLLVGMGCAVLFNIAAQTFMQQVTPNEMLGKVASFVSAICICAYPIGQSLYGLLLEGLKQHVWVVMVFVSAMGLILALATGRALRHVPQQPENGGNTAPKCM